MDTIEYITQKYGKLGTKIKGVLRNDFYKDFRELGFTEGVEVGVESGTNARAMFDAIPGLKLHLVDCWSPVGNRNEKHQRRHYRRTKNALREEIRISNAHIIRKWSLDAVKKFENESLDFVYIDANHNFDSVIQDIIQWSAKVRNGGIVAGHDYHYFRPFYGVVEAVNVYTKNHKLNWYLLDDEKPKRRQTNNTWFFVKGWKIR